MRSSATSILLILPLAACSHHKANVNDGAVYETYGVHNNQDDSPCASPDCRYVRGPGEPADPIYPPYWTSNWTMYRVFQNYQTHLPPYDGRPPAPLQEGTDYEVSYGATYYDSTWRGPSGDGAMMEHYEKRCLPIFPIDNQFTCSFISLGNAAFFVTYPEDRPKGMPPVCLFSKWNHPPRRDFVKHLPYSQGDSAQLGTGGQGYSFWVSAANGRPIQTGASPDRTQDPAILFGYAFAPVNGVVQPQSFYFSGYPMPPANAPIVSQNYTNFAPVQPEPAKTWAQVSGLDPATLPLCQLFDPPSTPGPQAAEGALMTAPPREAPAKAAPTWGDIGRWRKQ